MSNPFDSALADEAQLVALYPAAKPATWRKDIGHIDEHCRTLIASSPMVIVASTSAGGHCDATPRGGPAGFVTVLDDGRLAIPDATGNQRLDTLRNIVATGRTGLLFLIPGRSTTLRVNGRACVSADPDLLAAITAVGKPPRTAIVVEPDEVYVHCPKAFIRSGLWDPDTWPAPDALPTYAEVALAHQRDPALTLADVRASQAESVRKRLE